MEMNLQPLALTCRASGRAFADGDRVVSYLVRTPQGEMARYDLLAAEDANFHPEGFVFCRWINVFKPRPKEENRDRALKLTAENLFVTLADPPNEPNPVNTPLLQFLALLLERKRILRPRGRTPDGERSLLEHARTHQMYEIPAGELSPEFFVKIREQLGGLIKGSERKAEAKEGAPEGG
jgi:hypothetical protein